MILPGPRCRIGCGQIEGISGSARLPAQPAERHNRAERLFDDPNDIMAEDEHPRPRRGTYACVIWLRLTLLA
jgi:hypothetical protein